MTQRKGVTVLNVEREFVQLGGVVERSTQGHVKFTFPGLPCVGVHGNRLRAPRRLVSMLRKMQAGKVVTQPRTPVAEELVSPDPKQERGGVGQHPNPPRPSSVVGEVDMEITRGAAAALEQRKARDRAAAPHSVASPEPAPYVSQEQALVFSKDIRYTDIQEPGVDGDSLVAMFKDAERDGMAWWWSSAFEWLEEMEPWLVPNRHRALPRSGFRRYGIAIIKPVKGLRNHHTYIVDRGDDIMAVLTTDPATIARFGVSWERGRDYVRARCRARGLHSDWREETT